MGRRLRCSPRGGSLGAGTHRCPVPGVRGQAQTSHPQPLGHPGGRTAKRNKYVTGGPGTPCSPEMPTSPLGPWGGMERSKVSVGVEWGYKPPWGPKTPSPGTWQGMGSDPPRQEPPWEDHPPFPSPGSPSSFSHLFPSFTLSSPSSPRGRHAWLLLGSCGRGHSPACPACRAPRGHRGGLCVPKGEEEDCEHLWAEQWGRGSILTAASP